MNSTDWNPEDVLRTIGAFTNDFHNLGGGYIVIGVAEKDGIPVLPPVGLHKSVDKIQKEVLALGHRIQPPYHPTVAPYLVEGQQVLVLWCPGGQTRPYKVPLSLSADSREYGYFIRHGSSTVRAKGPDETELLGLAATVPFDDRVNQRAKVTDFKRSLIEDYLRQVGSALADEMESLSIEEIARQMRIAEGPKEFLLPQNVGLMFFNARPGDFFPQAQIDVVLFPDGPGADSFTEKSFTGPIDGMLRAALAYIRDTVIEERVEKVPDRAEANRYFNILYEALEEVLVNAVYHRGYDIREPIEVRVNPEGMTVLSYPGPDRSIALEDLKGTGPFKPRRYRNRRIGEFLKELEMTEGRCTGVPKIRNAMKRNGSPEPVFRTDDDRTYFGVFLQVHPKFGRLLKATGQVTGQVELEDSILRFCREPKSATEVMRQIGLSHRQTVRENYIQPLLKRGHLEMTIPDKPNSRLQRYKTTEQGREHLQRMKGE